MAVAELFNQLESNQPQVVEEIKKTFHELLNSTKESWLVSGLFDYYLATSSMRPVDILVGVREPHDKFLFDKISESLKGPSKLQALTFLGHIVRRHPTWIYKITTHPLMKELLKLLKTETEILCLMSALLVIIVLLPMIPTLIGPFLQDIFEIFSRLAAWNHNNPSKLPEEHLLHLQVSLYALFHRLYGMYPCNFLSFLRQEYGQREHLVIFSHTIKPMLETVRMHPLLVTASKDAETSTTRWKKMEDHDVIVECAKFALDSNEKSHEDSNYQGIATSLRSRAGLEASSGFETMLLQSGKSAAFSSTPLPGESDFWSPGRYSGLSTPPLQESTPTSIPQSSSSQSYTASSSMPLQEGTSPPEAAIEATPETTPVREIRHTTARPLPINSSAVRALTNFSGPKWQGSLTSGSSTPSQSQPSSPMKKDIIPFPFPSDGSGSAFEQPRRDSTTEFRRDSIAAQKLLIVQREAMQVAAEHQAGLYPKAPVQPTSPLRIIPHDASIPNSPVPSEPVSWIQHEQNGFRFESSTDSSGAPADSTQEDQEVLRIVREGEQLKEDMVPKQTVTISQRPCDSVLQDVHAAHVEEYEECQQESGSPCTSGGLHMPNSRSLMDFARRVHQQHRQRFYSQCVPEEKHLGLSTGSSPGEGSGFHLQERVRRANSCPEMKKGPALPSVDPNISRTLDESEEFLEEPEGGGQSTNSEALVNGQFSSDYESSENVIAMKRKRLISASTQTVDLVPLPYEHLFVSVFSPVEPNGVSKSGINTSPAPIYNQTEPPLSVKESPYQMLDNYIETVVQGLVKDEKEAKKPKQTILETELKILKEQVILLNIQLNFERQRREVHAERNRRLLRKSINNRALEEYNLALRDQVNLLQKAIEQSTDELEKFKKDAMAKEEHLQEAVDYWQKMCDERECELKTLKVEYQLRQEELRLEKEKTLVVVKDLQRTEAMLFDMSNEMKQAVAQASIGEQLKENLELLQKRLLLMGELQQKFRDRFSQLPVFPHYEDEVTVLQDSYHEEVEGLQEMLESRNSSLESVKTRVAELESVVTRKDALIADQKKVLKQVEEEYHVQLEAVENKYKAQRAINSKMEEHMLELYRKLDSVEDTKRKTTHSPDSSSIRSFSPHNSPLSQSLGSPGGLSVSGLLGRDTLEIKNLQVIVDQPELPASEVTAASQQQPTGTDLPNIAGEEG